MSERSIPETWRAATGGHACAADEAADARPRLFLLYHELRPDAAAYRYALATAEFARHMQTVRRLQEGASGLRPEVTFDDGHVSHVTEALPVLREAGVRARFFITAGWTARRADYLDWGGLRVLHAAGHAIGAHGMTHAMLTHCAPQMLDVELRGARKRLEDGLGDRVRTMSLPGGRFDRRVLEACRAAGYEEVFTSQPRAMAWPLDPRQPRLVGRLNLRSDATAEGLAELLDPASGVLRRVIWMDRAKTAGKRLLGDTLYRRLWATVNRADGAEAGGEEPYISLDEATVGGGAETGEAGGAKTPRVGRGGGAA